MPIPHGVPRRLFINIALVLFPHMGVFRSFSATPRKISLVIIGIIWCATILLAYRAWDGSRPPQHPLDIYTDSQNPRLLYRLRAHEHVLYDGLMVKLPVTTILTNSRGFRDSDWSREKPAGTSRIVILGDSMAFGLGVEQDQTFPSVLENMLQREGERYEVLNMAVPGYNTLQEVELFREEGSFYEPDQTILQSLANDWENITRVKQLFDTMHTRMPKEPPYSPAVEKAVFEQLWLEMRNMTFEDKWTSVEGPLRELHEQVNGTPVIILSFSFDLQKTKALDIVGAELGWPVLHIADIYLDKPYSKMIVHPKDVHPSPEAHHLIAQALLAMIPVKGRERGAYSADGSAAS